MLTNNLPCEIHWKIASYLNINDQREYSLVCRYWNKAARHAMLKKVQLRNEKAVDAFVDFLTKSHSSRELVKEIEVRTYNYLDANERYSQLIHLTPNVRTLQVGNDGAKLFRVAMQEIKNGHWQYLDCIKNYSHYSRVTTDLAKDYYALASAIQDKLFSLNLNVSPLPDSLSQLQCFQFPLDTIGQTRFSAVKHLNCYSDETTTVQLLDHALSLCPNATHIKLELSHLDQHKNELMHIKPHTKLKRLNVCLWTLSEAGLSYICHKFPKVEHFTLKVGKYIDDWEDQSKPSPFYISEQVINQLANYTNSLANFSLYIEGATNNMQLIHGFASLEWQGKSLFKTDENLFCIECDTSRPKFSEMVNRWVTDSFDLTQASIKDYLGQLDEIFLFYKQPKSTQILTHCTQLQSLRMTYYDACNYQGPMLPITRLSLGNFEKGSDSLKQLVAYTPYLKVLEYTCLLGLEFLIDIPSASLELLYLLYFVHIDIDMLFLHLVQSGVETYYQSHEHRLCETDISNLPEQHPELRIMKVKVICKDLKCLKFSNFSGLWHIMHDF
ncbi:hypothetical protein BD560DRAFT_400633 [Blakeslea trispora]|nr:hypothetical protein BD560DRAFT_400633 [Blakeslea trispora]